MKLCALSDSFRDAPGLRNGLHHFGCLINTITCPILWARLLPMEPLTVAVLLAALFHMILDLLKHAHRLLHSRRHNRRCPAFLVTIGLTICGHRQPALSLYCLHCPQPVIRHPATACDPQARIWYTGSSPQLLQPASAAVSAPFARSYFPHPTAIAHVSAR